ncbi:hypothetical protein BLNAU_13396 [Blattamonas nauphoetae]|uniref:Uncharacterized protein n=1 Tax=Blattamonas nauphoetae TaxID=2049346 RepID=A0ABQ9XM10_9EUKA|nr:hypothetical protein BLNAU_13396 [Blattamonas nauphoetae]
MVTGARTTKSDAERGLTPRRQAESLSSEKGEIRRSWAKRSDKLVDGSQSTSEKRVVRREREFPPMRRAQ